MRPVSPVGSISPVIATADLAALLDGEPSTRPTVLDVRWRLNGPPGVESYHAGHLPSAVYLDMDTDLASSPGSGGRHPLPEPAVLQKALRAAGVRRGRLVVAYDDSDSSAAARAWWLLRWAGHAEVAVLDGGFAAWQAEGRPLSTDQPTPPEGDIEVRPGAMPVLSADDAAGLARDGVLLDARVPARYAGETEPVDPRPGHIPGAVNAPFTAHTGQDGRWRDPRELARHYAELGVADDVRAGAYCGSGITASSVVLALELAGRTEPAALYPGSWSHWSADPERPAVLGPETG